MNKNTRNTIWTCVSFLLIFVVFLFAKILPDYKQALEKDKLRPDGFSIVQIGTFRAWNAYILTDKAGNRWFINDDIVIPLKDK